MLLQKTIKAKLMGLTGVKQNLLEREYSNYQLLTQSLLTNKPNCIETDSSICLYSATKQQALRATKKSRLKPGRQYPMVIRRDVIKVEHNETAIARYWARIPVAGRHGGIWVAINFAYKHEHLLDLSIRQARIIRKDGSWFIMITVQKEQIIKIPHNPRILSIDLGERYLAASVEFHDNSATNHSLFGKEARGIRRHHAWMRNLLGIDKNLRTIKRMKDKEARQINAILHNISSELVDRAAETDSVIVLGNLKGIRNSARGKGKRFNRIVSNMPYHKLTQYIVYKACWAGVGVFRVNEHYTSKTCHKCKSKGYRPKQGLFKCSESSCGLQYNADLNVLSLLFIVTRDISASRMNRQRCRLLST